MKMEVDGTDGWSRQDLLVLCQGRYEEIGSVSRERTTILYYSNLYSAESPCKSEALRAGNS